MEAGLSGGLHPGIYGILIDSIPSGDLGNLTAGPGFLDDGEFDLGCAMILKHRGIYKITKRGFVKETVSDN